MIGALNGCEMWPKVNMTPLIPPISLKLPGRPKLYGRRKDPEEDKKRRKKSGEHSERDPWEKKELKRHVHSVINPITIYDVQI